MYGAKLLKVKSLGNRGQGPTIAAVAAEALPRGHIATFPVEVGLTICRT